MTAPASVRRMHNARSSKIVLHVGQMRHAIDVDQRLPDALGWRVDLKGVL
jgi:hypothetical protein